MLVCIFMGTLSGLTGQAMAASSIVVAVDSPPRTMNPHGSDADCNLSVADWLREELNPKIER